MLDCETKDLYNEELTELETKTAAKKKHREKKEDVPKNKLLAKAFLLTNNALNVYASMMRNEERFVKVEQQTREVTCCYRKLHY